MQISFICFGPVTFQTSVREIFNLPMYTHVQTSNVSQCVPMCAHVATHVATHVPAHVYPCVPM